MKASNQLSTPTPILHLGMFLWRNRRIIKDRIPNHTPMKAALIWIQPIHERVIIHLDSMDQLTIIITANFNRYRKIITEIYITASTPRQRGIQVILHWVPRNVNPEGNEWADQLANEATFLEVIEHAKHTPGTVVITHCYWKTRINTTISNKDTIWLCSMCSILGLFCIYCMKMTLHTVLKVIYYHLETTSLCSCLILIPRICLKGQILKPTNYLTGFVPINC